MPPFNPLATMLDPGTFGAPVQPYGTPAPVGELPPPEGMHPLLGAMLQQRPLTDLYGPQVTQPDESSYGVPDEDGIPDEDGGPDVSQALVPGWNDQPDTDPDLLEPLRRDPSMKAQLMQAIIPLLTAGLVGKFGGGTAGATGVLMGANKAQADARERDLEYAKLDAVRRERALTRQAQNDQRHMDRAAKQQQVFQDLFKQANEFSDPAALNRWLKVIAPQYRQWGIDTTKLGSVVAPGAEKRAQEEAGKRYDQILANHIATKAKDKDFDIERFHDSTKVTWAGREMSLREFARVGGRAVAGTDAYEDNYSDAGKVSDLVRGMAEAFTQTAGRPPNRLERNGFALEAEKQLAAAKRDPLSQRVKEAQLRHYTDLAAARARKAAGQGAGTYTTQQQATVRALNSQYVAASKDFDQRARFYDQVTSTADVAKGNPVAQITLIFAYMKMIDPRSVVRESEQEQVGDTTSIPGRVMNWLQQVQGGGRLDDTQIAQLRGEAERLYHRHKIPHDRTIKQFTQRALRQGLDPRDVVMDYNAQGDDMVLPGVAPQPELERTAEGVIRPVTAPATPETPPVDFRSQGRTPVPGVGTGARVQAFGATPEAGAGGRPAPKDIRMGAPKAGQVSVGDPVYIGDPPTWKRITKIHPDGRIDAY